MKLEHEHYLQPRPAKPEYPSVNHNITGFYNTNANQEIKKPGSSPLYFLIHLMGCDHSPNGSVGVEFRLKDAQGGSFLKFFKGVKVNISTGKDTFTDMESKLMFLVVCVIGCAVSCIKADGHLSTPTNLTSNITGNECGKTKLCLDNPKGCDPSGSSQCFFTSVQINLTTLNLKVELSGNSSGYIALAAGVTSSVVQGLNIIFVCGNNNGRFFFRTATLLNNTLLTTNVPNVNNIQGSIQPSLIQCVFSIPIDANTINFLNNVNVTNVNISNIANSQLNVFLDVLQGSTN
ncbi:uncharacterized protein, partial [Sinocyclocheilus grahami]|uniref:uncharacterized protein n=1 Tax=Sinocyclocheilus grahami TaxID=75366 RepID=UPI0007AD1E01